MTKVHLYPRKHDGTPDFNAFGKLIDAKDLPPGSMRLRDIIIGSEAGPEPDSPREPITVASYVAPN